MKNVWQAFSLYTWCMEWYENDFYCMESYDKQFRCMEVNPGFFPINIIDENIAVCFQKNVIRQLIKGAYTK